jgi:hypothetical protein
MVYGGCMTTSQNGETGPGRWLYLYVHNANLLAGERLLDQRLSDGWEPFAVTEADSSVTVHIRRWDAYSGG